MCAISVVIPVYNGENYLAEAIDSILGQSFTDFELIVINDGSTDATVAILENYKDPRLKVVHNDGNKGIVYSLNKGLDLCQGKYIARMDADDIALPQRFQVQYDFMEANPDVGICGSAIQTFSDVAATRTCLKYPVSDLGVRAMSFLRSPFAHPTVILRKAVLDKVHLRYPIDFKVEDYAFWVEILKYTKGHNIPKVLLHYRVVNKSLTTNLFCNQSIFYQDTVIIQRNLFTQYDFVVDAEVGLTYARFSHSPVVHYSLTKDEQISLGKMITDLLKKVSEKDKSLSYQLQTEWSKLCFAYFFKKRKLPSDRILCQLYRRGICTYLKQFITHNS
ncbi:MAG: glycosyltransferase [Candidatus Symbiothrix sp.]|jgi:glycosyltransferase involved in cell wall biosynthesis|nr:glycosyltransferase [Candidatus Symbiothrix sp.]